MWATEENGEVSYHMRDWSVDLFQVESYGEAIIGNGNKPNAIQIVFRSGKTMYFSGTFRDFDMKFRKYKYEAIQKVKKVISN